MTEQDHEYARMCFAMMITNGLLARLNLDELNPVEIWHMADVILEAQDTPRTGLPAIKTKRRGTK